MTTQTRTNLQTAVQPARGFDERMLDILNSAGLALMTSIGHRGDAQRLEQIGFSAYLTKPLHKRQLWESLSLLMGQECRTGDKCDLPLITRHKVAESQKNRLRILLAEDNAVNRMVAISMLKKMGYRVDAVANGQEAVNALALVPYDLVLMDCQMPEMDGFEATRIIRNDHTVMHRANTPIVALTAHAMEGDRQRCLDAGMSDYLSKPFRPADLAAVLDRWLGEQPG